MNDSTVGTIAYVARIDTDELEKDGDKAEKIAKDTGDKVGSSIDEGLKTASKGLAVAGAGLTLYAKSATDFTVDLVKSSTKLGRELGTSTEEASRLVSALGRMGITTEQASASFGIFAKNIKEATDGSADNQLAQAKLQNQIEKTKREIAETTAEIKKNGDKTGDLTFKIKELNTNLAVQEADLKKSANAFDRIGVSTKDAEGKQKDFSSILLEVADKFKTMPDGIDKTALSMELFGRSGKDMIRVLNLGSDGIKDLEAQADKLGLTLTSDTIGKVNDLVQSQKNLKQQTDALKIAVGTETAPVLTKFNEKINTIVGSLLSAKGPIHDITVGVLAFGGPVLGASSAALGFAANLATISSKAISAASALTTLGLTFGVLVGPSIVNFNAATSAVSENLSKQAQAMAGLGFETSIMKPGVDALTISQNFLKQATDMVTTAQNNDAMSAQNLAQANTSLTGSNLQVEQAQKNLNEAVKRYGPNSLEARQAVYNLEQANLNQKKAVQEVENAQKAKQKTEQELAKKQDLKKTTEEANSALKEQESVLGRIGDKISGLGKKVNDNLTKSGKGFLKGLGIPGFASGVDNFSGGLAMVGEEGPELAFLPKGTSILPNKETKDLTTSRPSLIGSDAMAVSGGQSGSLNITVNVSGVMTDSTSGKRKVGEDIIRAVNDGLRAKGMSGSDLIGGGRI